MRLPIRALFTASLAAASILPLAAQAQQQLVPAQSEIQFVSRQMGVPVEGKFKTFSAQVAFDPAKLVASSIVFTVDTGSADISREANAELPKATWFNVAAFPKATFTSSSIKRIDACIRTSACIPRSMSWCGCATNCWRCARAQKSADECVPVTDTGTVF
jgi:polyisoprenoid-binding protein YceI